MWARFQLQLTPAASMCLCGILFVLLAHCKNTASHIVCAAVDNEQSL